MVILSHTPQSYPGISFPYVLEGYDIQAVQISLPSLKLMLLTDFLFSKISGTKKKMATTTLPRSLLLVAIFITLGLNTDGQQHFMRERCHMGNLGEGVVSPPYRFINVGMSIPVNCKEGYTPESFWLHCSNKGLSSVPCRQIVCPTPQVPSGGGEVTINGSGKFGSTAKITCPFGSRYDTTNPHTCGQNEHFNPDTGKCISQCGIQLPLPEGIIFSYNGHWFEFSCSDQNYVYNGVDRVTVPVCQQGEKYMPKGHCVSKESVRCLMLNIKHAIHPGTNIFKYGESYEPVCAEGYEYHGPVLKCSQNGTFDRQPGLCVPVECPPVYTINFPESVSIATASGSKYTDVVYLKPNRGFTCSFLQNITCQSNATWSEPAVDCVFIEGVSSDGKCYPWCMYILWTLVVFNVLVAFVMVVTRKPLLKICTKDCAQCNPNTKEQPIELKGISVQEEQKGDEKENLVMEPQTPPPRTSLVTQNVEGIPDYQDSTRHSSVMVQDAQNVEDPLY